MKKLLIAVAILIAGASCTNGNDTRNQEMTRENKMGMNETVSLAGKKLVYNYGDYVYELEFKSEDTLHWKCIEGEEQGKEADENYSMQRLNNHAFFISWVEQDGLGVSQVLNLRDNTVNCFLKMDKETIPLNGTVSNL